MYCGNSVRLSGYVSVESKAVKSRFFIGIDAYAHTGHNSGTDSAGVLTVDNENVFAGDLTNYFAPRLGIGDTANQFYYVRLDLQLFQEGLDRKSVV